MAHGLQVFDSSGNTIIDISTKVGNIVGTVNTGTTNGSVTDSKLSTGIPIYILYSLATYSAAQPVVTASGSTISWDWGSISSGGRVPCILIYGVA